MAFVSEMTLAGRHSLLTQGGAAQEFKEAVSELVQTGARAIGHQEIPQASALNGFSTEAGLLVLSFLFFISLLAGKAGSKYGVPVLVLFLAVGMVAGAFWVDFGNNYGLAQTVGTIALAVILFSGGMDTKIQEVRPIMVPGVLLATVGVVLTAFITGLLIWGWASVFPIGGHALGFLTCLLLASVMSSTDSASVFSILRSKGVALKHNLRPLLELESGSNDPMAYMLTICLISIINTPGDISYWGPTTTLLLQFVIGSLSGYYFGKLTVFIANHIKIDNESLYPILSFTAAIFVYFFTYTIKGNGFLAVYICGLVIGNSKMIHKRSTLRFFDGFAWLCQILMFLTLGLLVDPIDLIAWDVLIPGIAISVLMIFITRPASVFLCLAPLKKITFRDKLFISWVGLRGAVPIIFAILPLVYDVPNARYIFNIVFFITLVSLLVQGTTLAKLARLLRLVDKAAINRVKAKEFDLELCSDMGSFTTEITINKKALSHGGTMIDLPLPENAVVALLKRGGKYIVPNGSTHILLNDILLIITDDEKAINQTHKALSIGAAEH
jgi:cell volume regulation protein A